MIYEKMCLRLHESFVFGVNHHDATGRDTVRDPCIWVRVDQMSNTIFHAVVSRQFAKACGSVGHGTHVCKKSGFEINAHNAPKQDEILLLAKSDALHWQSYRNIGFCACITVYIAVYLVIIIFLI